MKLRTGDLVKMSEELKAGLMKNGSEAHALEFGNCEGIVEDRMFPNLPEKDAPEVNVRWLPSKLRYGYDSDELILIKGIKDRRKEKLKKINEK